jgi:hypothetical protein
VIGSPLEEWGKCGLHVAERVVKYGGEIVYRVVLYRVGDFAICGLRHAVWKYKGQYIDISKTPRVGQEYLFVQLPTPPIAKLLGLKGMWPADIVMFMKH